MVSCTTLINTRHYGSPRSFPFGYDFLVRNSFLTWYQGPTLPITFNYLSDSASHLLLNPSSCLPLFKRSLSLTCSHISISSTIVSLATSGLPI